MILAVKVKPNARADAVLGWEAGVLLVAVTAPPVDGKANTAVLRLLAKRLGLAPSRLSVLRGTTGRHKQVELPDGTDLTPLG